MFITAPSIRRSGFGRPLFQAAMDDIATHKVQYCGLDAVKEQVPTYSRRGFVDAPNGKVRCMIRPFEKALPHVTMRDGLVMRAIEQADLEILVRNEKRVVGFERKGLWTREFLHRPDVKSVIILDESREGDDALLAWTVVRRAPGGARLGPVYAVDAATAGLVVFRGLELATPEFVKDCPLPGVVMSHLSLAEIRDTATTIVEVSLANLAALQVFEDVGFNDAGVDYHRMWLDGKVPPAQAEGGTAESEMFAVYDAAIG